MNARFRMLLLALLGACVFAPAGAQNFPTRPIRILVPLSPG